VKRHGRIFRKVLGRYGMIWTMGSRKHPANFNGSRVCLDYILLLKSGVIAMDGKIDVVKGRIKEAAGALTGNDALREEGRTDQAVGEVKEAVDKVADKVKGTVEKTKDAVKKALK